MSAGDGEAPLNGGAAAAIAREIGKFIEAYDVGDAGALLATYSDDLIKLRQGAPDERKAETERRLRDVFAEFDGRVEVEPLETIASGDLAVVRGTFVVTLTPKAGGPRRVLRRRYLEVWRREGERLRVIRTMDNTAE